MRMALDASDSMQPYREVSKDDFVRCFAFCRQWKANPSFDRELRNTCNSSAPTSKRHKEALATIRAVWSVNRARGEITRALFDTAMWTNASVLPLLRECRKHSLMRRVEVAGTVACDLCGDVGPERRRLQLYSTAGALVHSTTLRHDLAAVVTCFHVLTWYLEYLCALARIDGAVEIARFEYARQLMHLTMLRAGAQTGGANRAAPRLDPPSPARA